ncbi:MAG: hypothetical protein ABID63_12355 [Pseudomonadota bacterium]
MKMRNFWHSDRDFSPTNIMILLGFLVAFGIWIPQTQAREIPRPVLTIHADHDAYPHSFQIGDQPSGLFYDLLQDFTTRHQISLSYRLRPLKRALEDTLSGDGGFIGIDTHTIPQGFLVSNRIISSRLYAVSARRAPLDIRSIDDLEGLQVGLMRGMPMFRERTGINIDISYFNSTRQAVALVLAGRLDVALIQCGDTQNNALKFRAGLDNADLDRLTLHNNPILEIDSHLFLPDTPANRDIMAKFNTYLAVTRTGGQFDDILHSYDNTALGRTWLVYYSPD